MSELLQELSRLSAASLLRPARPDEPDDPVLLWQQRFKELVEPPIPHLLKAVSFSSLHQAMEGLLPSDLLPAPRIHRHGPAVWIRGNGALYDAQTGLALPGSYLSRFPRERQVPHCSAFRVELACSTSSLPCLDRAVVLPYAVCSNFGHFATETLAFLWPFLLEASAGLLVGMPVLLPGCHGGDPTAQLIQALLRQAHAFPLLEDDLPKILRIDHAYIPDPSLRLHAACTETHLQASGALGHWLENTLASSGDLYEQVDRLFISRTALVGDVRRVERDSLVDHLLAESGWKVFHPEQHPLPVQVATYRRSRVIAGFEGSALHGLALLGPQSGGSGPVLLMLGDQPSVDYFLQFRAQQLRGFFLPCTRVNPESAGPEHLRGRLLNANPETLVSSLNALARCC